MILLVNYHYLAHYRAAVFRQMAADQRWQCRFLADPSSARLDPTIAVWNDCPPPKFTPCPIRLLSKKLYIQPKVLLEIIKAPRGCVIFLSNMYAVHVWLGAILARFRGHRVLFWGHGWILHESSVRAWVRRRFYSCAHAVLLYGRRAKVIATEQGFPAHRLHVIYNSLDVDAQRDALRQVTEASLQAFRTRIGLPVERKAIICTTRLTKVRRLDLLIEAAAGLSLHKPAILLVGDGPERNALAAQAAQLGVTVIFLGTIYDEETIAHAYACASVTVAPGKVGLTAMHSMAYGCPVLTHDAADDQMPEWEAIIPGKTGDLFHQGDVASMRDAIARWLDHPDRMSVVQACNAVIDRFYNPGKQIAEIAKAIRGENPTAIVGDRIQADEIVSGSKISACSRS